MGDSELAAVVREPRRTIRSNNLLCRREMNARLTGGWHLIRAGFQRFDSINFTTTKRR